MFLRILISLLALALPLATLAQDNPLAPGWTLDPGASALRFQSVKNETKAEQSGFATLSGTIGADGAVELRVALDSVDTKIDLRNVRMRFLFFETFKFPEAVITARLDPADLADLAEVRRKTLPITVTLDLHGVQKEVAADVVVTLLTDDRVSVASGAVVNIATADFGLDEGVRKLEEAAKVDIVPSGGVTFDFVFDRNADGATAEAPVTEEPASTALEAQGDFDAEACKGRFEILSRTGNIYFASGSARLTEDSRPLLDAVTDIVRRCPGLTILIAGHTDDLGSEAANEELSRARAEAVALYLTGQGIAPDRFRTGGFGERRPVADNATPEGRARNRRIEFAAAGD
jgi:outer membrane protein OmpA-like peptidoglycan-associated protein